MARIMRGMNIIAKIKSLGKKRLLVITTAIVLILAGIWWFFLADKSPLTEEQKAENKSILEVMNKSRITGGVDSTRLANIEASKYAGKYAEALQQTNILLAEPNLSEQDRRTLFVVLSSLCPPLRDFACADRVIAEYGKLLPFDPFFLIDMARLAASNKQTTKAKEYYTKALTEIDSRGGQAHVNELNSSADASLDYNEIKRGAGQ